MTRETWNTIERSKSFYVRTYRKAAFALTISLALNLIFIVAIYYSHVNRPRPDFYATSGVEAPIKLTPIEHPNYSSEAMLPPDPVNENETKVIPQ